MTIVAKNATREDEYWTPEPLFQGETVFCLASGPSLTAGACEKVRGRRAIVVNSSCLLAPWADVLFFTDSGWFEQHQTIVANWPGLVVTLSRRAKRDMPNKVQRVKGAGDPTYGQIKSFPSIGTPFIRQGRSSGHTAISLAIAMGAKRIALLGYDMQIVNGREHCHTDYKGPRDHGLYAREFLPAFRGWHAAAIQADVEIINCTPDSAVTEFPFADLDEVLACAPS